MSDLLKPRIQLLANYPGNDKVIGSVLLPDSVNLKDECVWYIGTFSFTQNTIKEFPAVFRLLHWWEYRGRDEMPHYVLNVADGCVFELVEYNPEKRTPSDVKVRWLKAKLWSYHSLYDLVPATELEFLNQEN